MTQHTPEPTIFTEEHHGMQLRTTQEDIKTLRIFQMPEKPTLAERVTISKRKGEYLGPTEPCNEHMNDVLEINRVIAHPVTMVDTNSGESRPAMRTVFVSPDGKRYSGTSEALYRFAQQVLLPDLTETGEWGPLVAPVKIRFSRQKTRGGFGTYAPEVVE